MGENEAFFSGKAKINQHVRILHSSLLTAWFTHQLSEFSSHVHAHATEHVHRQVHTYTGRGKIVNYVQKTSKQTYFATFKCIYFV